MIGDTHGHRLQPTRRLQRHPAAAPQDQRQRTRPEAFGQQARGRGHLRNPVFQLLRSGDVDDQRVGGRTALDLEDPRDGGGVLGVGAQTVDGLGRQGHQAPRPQHPRSLLDVTGCCRHPHTSLSLFRSPTSTVPPAHDDDTTHALRPS
jgi:hypothetical protein